MYLERKQSNSDTRDSDISRNNFLNTKMEDQKSKSILMSSMPSKSKVGRSKRTNKKVDSKPMEQRGMTKAEADRYKSSFPKFNFKFWAFLLTY